MIKGEIKAGICGFQATVEADSPDGMNVELRIQSDCPRVQTMATELTSVDAFQEIFKPLNRTQILELAARHKLHTACVVPVGILKCAEAAAHLALPATSVIALTREE
jgi:hypothetical protein